MFHKNNLQSQPLKDMPVFNNWKVVVEGWYCAGRTSDLSKNGVLNFQIGFQELVVFCSSEGNFHCLDAFCSHMGLKLSTGKVVQGKLQCKFHHWQYNGNGDVFDSGCKKLPPARNLKSYPVEIRYGLIWVWAGETPLYSLPWHPDLSERKFSYRLGKEYSRPSHPHISLLNALDIQHVNTVHALELNVTGKQSEPSENVIHFDFEGTFLRSSKGGRRNAWLTGGGYKFSVRYAGATVGYLKALEGIKLFGILPFPSIYATFGYRQVGNEKTMIQPVFLTPRRKGITGALKSYLHLKLTEMIYNRLKNEDGEIYENIRFTPHLTAEDSNIAGFIAHVNRLPKSSFSIS